LTAVLHLRASTFQVGLLAAVESVVFLLVGLPSGPFVDRRRKRPILVACNLGRLFALASIPVAALAHVLTIWQLYAAAFVVALLSAPFRVAYQSYLPSLVEERALVAGAARMEASGAVADIAGPPLAGALVGLLTAPIAIGLDAASYLLSTLAIRTIPAAAEQTPPPVPRGRYIADIREGMRFVVRHPALRAIAATNSWSGFFEGIDAAVIVVFLSLTLRASPVYIGVVFGLCAVGGLGGALVAAKVVNRFGTTRTLIGGIGLGSPFLLLAVIAQPGWSTLLVGLGGVPLWTGLAIYHITQYSYRQTACPPALRGRMNATMQVINNAFMPLGAVIGATLGVWLGLRATMAVAAIGLSLSFLWLLRLPRAPSGRVETNEEHT
jgi:MFS family permease